MMDRQLDISLAQALGIPRDKGVTALVGGGGKTTLMYRLGAEYAARRAPVIVTTTTRIGVPRPEEAALIEADEAEARDMLARPGEVICVGTAGEPGKLHGLAPQLWQRCLREAERVFVEGDGAKMLPVKAPAAHEPVIPAEADTVVAVAGLSAIGQPLREVGFRCDNICALLGVASETLLTPALLARLLTSERGQFKGVGDAARFRVFLNQADDERALAAGMETAEKIREYLPRCRVAVGRLLPEVRLWAVTE